MLEDNPGLMVRSPANLQHLLQIFKEHNVKQIVTL